MTWLVRSLAGKIRSILAANLAKRTAFWNLSKIYQGTYETSVRRLHSFHSDVVQVGPHEYCISDPVYFEGLAHFQNARNPNNLPKTSSLTLSQVSLHHYSHTRAPVDDFAFKLLARSLKMGNIFHYEADIESCNDRLLQVLAK